LRREGIHLSTPETLRSRLDLLVASGVISAQLADALFAASPFHGKQQDFDARVDERSGIALPNRRRRETPCH
jgi:hypothetical protein